MAQRVHPPVIMRLMTLRLSPARVASAQFYDIAVRIAHEQRDPAIVTEFRRALRDR